MCDFKEADKKKKQVRIQIKENPGDLPKEVLSQRIEKIAKQFRNFSIAENIYSSIYKNN